MQGGDGQGSIGSLSPVGGWAPLVSLLPSALHCVWGGAVFNRPMPSKDDASKKHSQCETRSSKPREQDERGVPLRVRHVEELSATIFMYVHTALNLTCQAGAVREGYGFAHGNTWYRGGRPTGKPGTALAAMHRSSPSSIREFLTRGLEQATNQVMLSLLNGLSLTTVHTATMMNLVGGGFDIPSRASQLVRVIDPCLSSAAGKGWTCHTRTTWMRSHLLVFPDPTFQFGGCFVLLGLRIMFGGIGLRGGHQFPSGCSTW